jgi:hypothetical protein
MNCDLTQSESKKAYEAPKLTTISLRPEEAVLGACKTATGRDQCGNPCMSFTCKGIGS